MAFGGTVVTRALRPWKCPLGALTCRVLLRPAVRTHAGIALALVFAFSTFDTFAFAFALGYPTQPGVVLDWNLFWLATFSAGSSVSLHDICGLLSTSHG